MFFYDVFILKLLEICMMDYGNIRMLRDDKVFCSLCGFILEIRINFFVFFYNDG